MSHIAEYQNRNTWHRSFQRTQKHYDINQAWFAVALLTGVETSRRQVHSINGEVNTCDKAKSLPVIQEHASISGKTIT